MTFPTRKPGSVSAVEYSDKAMEYLTRNIELNRSKVTVYNGDVLNPKL